MTASPPPPSPLHHPSATAAAAAVSASTGGSVSITTETTSTTVAPTTRTVLQRYSKSLQVLSRMAGGVVVLAMPVGYWWYHARQERDKVIENVRTKIRIPSQETIDEIMIEKHCQPGDVVVFDRRCDTCATSPWAAFACWTSRQFLCADNGKDDRHFIHMGLIVPGYINSRHDAHDPMNLLLLEATPSQGIVARPLLSRLEHSQSRSVWLLQLACPGEQRTTSTDNRSTRDSRLQPPKSTREARQHVERQLIKFRDQWTELSRQHSYAYMHSTLCIGGALAYQTGLLQYSGSSSSATSMESQLYKGPVSPSAWLCFMGLQKANAAQNIHDTHLQLVRVQDFVNVSTRRTGSGNSSYNSEDVIRLRPGWRFLAPIPLRESNSSQ